MSDDAKTLMHWIEAFARSEVRARVAGSGDIMVRGNLPRRDHSVAGSGKIKFR